jgi:hypothetical protein
MNLIKFKHRYDFGHDWYVQIVNIKRLSLLQISISWSDYSSWPYLQVKSGTGDVLDILFWVHKFGIDITLIGRTWRWDHIDEVAASSIDEFDEICDDESCSRNFINGFDD